MYAIASERITNFTTVFLGIILEAMPFLLLGTIASGMVEVFLSQDRLVRFFPRRVFPATLMGSLMGFAFPICECGVVPLTKRLYGKGLPIAVGVAFLLAAPILNPLVIASTFAAYGWGPVLFGRLGLGLIVAVGVGLIFSLHGSPAGMLRAPAAAPATVPATALAPLVLAPPRPPHRSTLARLRMALRIAGDEFFDMARFLVIGAALAALMQTFLPAKTLLAAGSGPLTSVLVMQGVAVMLSVCSTVDAFLSLAFVGTFTTGAILSFLVFGPMIDIKSTLMFLRLFRPKMVVYLILLVLFSVTAVTLFINLNVAW